MTKTHHFKLPEPLIHSSDAREERSALFERYDILRTKREKEFDDIVLLAKSLLKTPFSVISFLDGEHQWFKAEIGLGIDQTRHEDSFCRFMPKGDHVFIIKDTLEDERVRHNPYVQGEPGLRFYAGAPLQSPEGMRLGTLCVLDTQPREFNAEEREILQALSRQVMALLELRRAKHERKIAEERLHFALDTSSLMGTWDWDLQQDLVYLDERTAEWFSVDPSRARIGASSQDLFSRIHPEDADWVVKKFREAVARSGELSEQFRILSDDGNIRWVLVHGQSHSATNGEPIRFPGAIVDITDKKRAERKQAALIELYQRLPNLKSSAEITGVAAELIGKTLFGTRAGYGQVDPEVPSIMVENDWCSEGFSSLKGLHYFRDFGEEFAESVVSGEVIVINDIYEDTRTAPCAERCMSIDVRSLINVSLVRDGRVCALFYIHDNKPRAWREGEVQLVKDMAQRTWAADEKLRAEEQMMAALKEAEAANIAKTEFLANMSHEIRTPMNAIIGLSNILAGENLTPRQKEYMRTLQMSADSLLALINDLLDISKIEARTVELEQIRFDLAKMLQEIISMMNVKAKEKNLEFSMDSDFIKMRDFIGDPTRIRQIVVNLCSNAIKFTDKGRIHIHVTGSPGDEPGIENISISVEDTGVGIAASQLEHIFEKFVQADTSINRKYGGTGLGLAITKTLAGIMGGDVTVESELGKGSKFTVTLPLKVAENSDDFVETIYKNSKDKIMSEHKKRVLLVEDYAPNVLVAGTFLEEFGYDWDSAKSGNEAVAMFERTSYDAILMDVQMFGMNGLEATRLIRAFEAGHKRERTPIIGMTAHALAGDRERCLGVGMDDYISKPFNPNELQDKLYSLTNHSTVSGSAR